MEIKQKISINQERLERINQGINFLNIEERQFQKDKEFYLNVFLEIKQNLKERIKETKVSSNLPMLSRWWGERSIEDFFEEIENFSKKPLFFIKESSNRKENPLCNDRDIWNLKQKIRNTTISFNDFKLNITDLARKNLKQKGIDFEERLKRILNQQTEINKEKQKLIDRFVYLKEKVSTLKTFLKRQEYGYYNKEKESLKILMTPQEYNKNLKEIEDEMKKIAKELNLELEEMEYLKILKRVDFKEWFEYYKERLREDFEEEETEEDFEEYSERLYEQSEGVIEE